MASFLIAIKLFIQRIWHGVKNAESELFLLFLTGLLATGTIIYSSVENWSFLDSLYFCVVTLTTVGYGDFHPITNAGKLFTIGYIFIGFILVIGFVNSILKHPIEDNYKKALQDAEFYRELKKYK